MKTYTNQLEESQAGVASSLFVHEKTALDKITQRIRSLNLGEALCNLELHDVQSNRYFETDLVLIAKYGIYIIELKHWSGTLEVRPNTWIQNRSFHKRDPHKANNFKAKLLKGIFERKYPHFPSPFFESVVVFTNPEIDARGCTNPKKAAHLPTFESIDRLLEYLKIQAQHTKEILNIGQCQKFSGYLSKLNSTSIPKDFVFQGYKIVERLYQYDDRAEVVALRTDLRHRRLSRLRIFYPGSGDLEARQRAHERSTATLNAVTLIGDHPNILRVVDVPNENNYVVESSEWSETGTLRDFLNQKVSPNSTEIVEIILGLARGLELAHSHYVVHRALSPENVLMVNGVPKLMNFDLSYQLEEDRVTVIPDATKIKRTPYIAPEVLIGGIIPEASADLFSLGVIFYEMLTGSTPFKCSIDLEQMGGQLTSEQHKRLSEVVGAPPGCTELILKLIQLHPSDRLGDDKIVIDKLTEGSGTELPKHPETNPRLNVDEQAFYSISKFICEGAESQIYEAIGPQEHRVALKLFNLDVPLSRVLNEAKTTGAVHHLNIVRIDNHNQWPDGRYYIAFDWVSSVSLRDKIKAGQRPNVQQFMIGAEQLLDALQTLHQDSNDGSDGSTLHNDIKPDNILIGNGDRLILIDFGIASKSQIGTYAGTEGYVAPDLRLGEDREFSINGDLYSLSVSLYEWLTGTYPTSETVEVNDETGMLIQTLQKGFSDKAGDRFQSAAMMWNAIRESLIIPESPKKTEVEEVEEIDESSSERDSVRPTSTIIVGVPKDGVEPNPFVAYLNSLQSTDAASQNSLAEFQAMNPNYNNIHVSHPITKYIESMLTSGESRHVVLTGHAGDGKSTVAIEIYKLLNDISPDHTLNTPLQPRENIKSGRTTISLIKDFSEWSPSDRSDLMREMLDSNGPHFLLVSNTGTLLDTFKNHSIAHDGSWLEIESRLLTTMDQSEPIDMDYLGMAFTVINIANMDNLGIGELIFDRMLAEERWNACAHADCHIGCPIFSNITLMKANKSIVRERIFSAYRRMYEYGTRLTLRQLSAHLAYTITAGQNYMDIKRMSQRAKPHRMSEFMFFNRIFGDNGVEVDPKATQLRGVVAMRDQKFGSQLSADWERRIWLRSQGKSFKINAVDVPEDYEVYRQHGVGLPDDRIMTDQQARDQVRRMIYFLHDFSLIDNGIFQKVFLRSGMILDFIRWQKQKDESLEFQERSALKKRILHVLQEHFTGVRIPEGHKLDNQLFITLNRHSHDIRQSAQVVLATYGADEFNVRLARLENPTGEIRRELVLDGPLSDNQLKLQLTIPFLDYVMRRNRGEIGKELQTSFIDRLERFKGQLIPGPNKNTNNDIMLVRLHANHSFQRQLFAVRSGRLEVTDA